MHDNARSGRAALSRAATPSMVSVLSPLIHTFTPPRHPLKAPDYWLVAASSSPPGVRQPVGTRRLEEDTLQGAQTGL